MTSLPNDRRRLNPWILFGLLAALAAGLGGFALSSAPGKAARADDHSKASSAPDSATRVQVETIHPKKGDMDRSTSQPGSIQAFESVRLLAGVSGYLKEQNVDIGDTVKRGQVLAVLDVPEQEKKAQRQEAEVAQARARVAQMESRVLSAKADVDVAQAGITFAEASAKSKAAELRFREKQLARMKDLFALKSIDERLVDEKTEQRDTAQESERAARASISSSKAQLAAATAKVAQAQADLLEAQSAVKVATAEFEQQQVVLNFATIRSPCDGVITHRALFPGDFVRAADAGGQGQPMLTVQCIDRFRVIVQVPDRDVPYTHRGDPAEVEVDALPGEKFLGKVSRIAQSEDPQTRLMHVEIDLPNKDGRIAAGMYGRVKILLEKSAALSLPVSALVGKNEAGRSTVYVVRDSVAHAVPVRVGGDNGVKVAILSGLSEGDAVIVNPNAGLSDGTAVSVSVAAAKVH
jgi:RND family efflux transporter MFP subunit